MKIIFLFMFMLQLILLRFPSVYMSLLQLHCAQHDQSSLLRLKHSLVVRDDLPSEWDKLASWNSGSDCCVWRGVTCSLGGDVVGVDLSRQLISGGVDSLFDLHHLRSLDLSYNRFNGTRIPPGIGKLVNLLHLNLSFSGFGGQVPIEISTLTSLITLKIVRDEFLPSPIPLKLENPKFSVLIKNLKSLIELNLDGVNMSTESEGHRWCHALSSSLRALSLSGCSLSGPPHDSLLKLHALTSIDLSGNNLSVSLSGFLANFSNLTRLRLSDCGLYGDFPPIPTSMLSLQFLDLSNNKLLSGTLPEGIGNMTSLTDLWLGDCGFSGSITHIHWENLGSLANLLMFGNKLSGSAPMSLFSLPSMVQLDLSSNQFSGQLGEVETANFEFLSLNDNKLEGPIPTFILNLGCLVVLSLSNNNFSGTIDLTHLFQNLGNISYLGLSFNSLSIIQTPIVTHFAVPQLYALKLASCNLTEFPSLLRNQSSLQGLDLAQNKISGKISSWIWEHTQSIDLSHNLLIGFETVLPNLTFPLDTLNLKSNKIYGQIPNWIWEYTQNIDLSDNLLIGFETLLPNLTSPLNFLNLKSNLLQGQIPLEFGNHFPYIVFLSLSTNKLHGLIPQSFCNITMFSDIVIDLSNNSLSGTIPPCLLAINLGVLNLKNNNLTESIPNAFPSNCSLETLDLSENQLNGTIPESMVNCKALKVINFGHNQLSGGFPCWLIHTSNLTILVLRSNRFYGPVGCALSNEATNSWSKLQIIDVAVNNFDGELPHTSFKYWTTMMTQPDNVQPKLEYLGFGSYYQDTLTIINKGNVMELVKILTIFNAIDFSCNHFKGSIPQSIGDLKSLHALNLSHNHLRGSIPPSIGNLEAVESLDLAKNNLSGIIPEQLASLNFISYLNLSFNRLVGRIPTSTQLQSFSNRSYTGNKGLCGPPLEINCANSSDPITTNGIGGKEVDWKLISGEVGYAVGLASVIGSLMFWKRWNVFFFEIVNTAIFKLFPSLDPQNRKRETRVHKTSN